ncbi:MAG TPA: hypothetical protein VFH88_07740 [Candidatus Krumholzibacteria bacterium]|nr:hypothetical protein [Candidatus Krumholzibacteria bacterium]
MRAWNVHLLLVVAIAVAASIAPATFGADTPDPLAPVAPLEGGTWTGEGAWPDGSPLKVEVHYFWGPTKHVLHFDTYDLSGDTRQLIYEGIIFYDPSNAKLMEYNFKPSGDVDRFELINANQKGFEMLGNLTRSAVHYVGPDEFEWKLHVQKDGKWNQILDARYHRTR